VLDPDDVGDATGTDYVPLPGELLEQLRVNLAALRVTILRTEVSWDDFDLLAFFKHEGFAPARRLCLDCVLDPTRIE
ncbi:MAG: hypothetical protein LAO22_23880, partial [Acidobacteriia bacterium]|nr:hypothetical protein [Terriglobia bacterium]